MPLDIKKEMAKAILHRVTVFELTGKPAQQVAKNMILGASNLAAIQEDKDLAQELHSMFTDVVEFGFNLVYRLAGVPAPQKDEAQKEAA